MLPRLRTQAFAGRTWQYHAWPLLNEHTDQQNIPDQLGDNRNESERQPSSQKSIASLHRDKLGGHGVGRSGGLQELRKLDGGIRSKPGVGRDYYLKTPWSAMFW
jgi:hypothetical protein